MKIQQSKLIISLGIVFSLVGVFYFLFLHKLNAPKIIIVEILFYSVLVVYQLRYFFLINFVKADRVTFQLIEKQKRPIILDTLVGLVLFCAFPFVLAIVHKTFNHHIDMSDIIAVMIYLVGTMITLISEFQRRKWKVSHANKLYRGGLFKYANHINYFGETLSLPAFFWLATGSEIIFFLTLAHQIIDFAFVQIPKQEKYLRTKYPKDFEKIAYQKKLIPKIY